MGSHGEHGIQKQNALPRPRIKDPSFRGPAVLYPKIVLKFPEDIHKRRRLGDARLHTESESVRLPRLVIRILPQYHHFDIVIVREPERVVDIRRRRIYRPVLIFFNKKRA